MSILTFEFLGFIGLTLIFTYLLPLKVRWIGLLVSSAVFGAFAGWQSIAYLTGVAVLTWLGGLGLARLKDKRLLLRRLLLAFLLILDIGAMAFIKYALAAAGWVDALTGGSASEMAFWNVAAPIGLSYFTFQSAGLLIDIYRGKAELNHNPLQTWLFLGYFPQLTQGPISTWKELGGQLSTGHRFEPENLISGFVLMLWGYFKKMAIADRLLPITNMLQDEKAMPGWLALGGLVLYAVRLYTDFSGGMDVVRGVSRMLGVELPENFRRPFFSQSVAEYWRRWHIALGTWFKSYLMYPLTTSRAGIALSRGASKVFGKKFGRMVPTALATLIVFLLIGIWHSANWNAVIYGGYFGLIMSASILLDPVWKMLNRRMKLPKNGWMKPIRLIRTWILVVAAQAFACTSNPTQGLFILRSIFGSWSFTGFGEQMTSLLLVPEWIILGIALVILFCIDWLSERKTDVCGRIARGPIWVRWPILILLILTILILGVYGDGMDAEAFVYAQF